MADFKEGDIVLIPATVELLPNDGRPRFQPPYLVRPLNGRLGFNKGKAPAVSVPDGSVEPHPGVPVEALLEEIRRLWEALSHYQQHPDKGTFYEREASKLRAAREAAQKPTFKAGEKVWVRGIVEGRYEGIGYHPSVKVKMPDQACGCGLCCAIVSPDDIRKDE
jgi:hypothetical protein